MADTPAVGRGVILFMFSLLLTAFCTSSIFASQPWPNSLGYPGQQDPNMCTGQGQPMPYFPGFPMPPPPPGIMINPFEFLAFFNELVARNGALPFPPSPFQPFYAPQMAPVEPREPVLTPAEAAAKAHELLAQIRENGVNQRTLQALRERTTALPEVQATAQGVKDEQKPAVAAELSVENERKLQSLRERIAKARTAARPDSDHVRFTITISQSLADSVSQNDKKRRDPPRSESKVPKKKTRLIEIAKEQENLFSEVKVIPRNQAIFPLPAYSPRRLVLFNLAQNTTLQTLFNALRPFGFISDLFMVTDGDVHHENFAFVLFRERESAAAAYEALYGKSIDNQAICIDYINGAFNRTNRKLKVSAKNNLAGYTPAEIETFFSQEYLQSVAGYSPYAFSIIEGEHMHGYMVFNDLDAAQAAKTHFHKLGFHVSNVL